MYVKMSLRRLMAGQRRTKSNTRGEDLWLLSRYLDGLSRQEYLSMQRIDPT